MIRFTACLALLAFALPAVAQEKPAVVFQAKSPAALLSHIRDAVKFVADKEGLEAFETELTDLFGEDGFKGLNLTQPVFGYARLEGKPEETSFVLVVPISNEKEFLELLDRLEFKAEEDETEKGAYALKPPGESTTYLRMTATHAYIAVNATAKTVATKSLIPVKDLLDPNELGIFALNVYPDRVGKEYRDAAVKALEKMAADENLGDLETKWMKGLKPMAEMLLTQAERLTVRGDLEPVTKMTTLDLKLVPKKNSLLSFAFAARKPSSNRFAGVGKAGDFTQVILGTFPAWTKDICEGMAASLTEFGNFTKLMLQGPGAGFQPSIAQLIEGMAGAAKAGELDLASFSPVPDKDGKITTAFALRVSKPDEFEKELLALVEEVSKDDAVAKKINLTAAKHAGVAIHTLDLGDFLDKPMKETLGEKAKLAIACSKDAVYIAVGANAVETVKTLIDAKAGEAAAFEMHIQPKAFAESYRGMGQMELVEKALGTSDKPARLAALTATSSAAELHMRLEVSLALIRFGVQMQNAPGPPAP